MKITLGNLPHNDLSVTDLAKESQAGARGSLIGAFAHCLSKKPNRNTPPWEGQEHKANSELTLSLGGGWSH